MNLSLKNRLATICTFATLLVSRTLYAAPQDEASKLTEDDRLRIAVQQICPVAGAELGSMGDPVQVQVGQQVVFLCCASCQSKKIDTEHWQAIQSRIAKAQGICPVMEKPVDAQMESTVVDGVPVFVCCPPCIEKIQADPAGTLDKVRANYTAFVQEEFQAESDRLLALAQKICPVSGEQLGSQEAPVKVQVGKEHILLANQECVGQKIDPALWQTVQSNLAKAQGICPVMEKEVDSTMESTIVNGRRIYVCCPPCINKIEAEPTKYALWLTEQFQAYVDDRSNSSR